MSKNELLAFVNRLNRSGLLDPAQREQVSRQLLPGCADAEALARQLIARRWLTARQARALLAGRTPAAPAAPPPKGTLWRWLAAGVLAAVVMVVGLVLLVQHLRRGPDAPQGAQAGVGDRAGEERPEVSDKLRRLAAAPATQPARLAEPQAAPAATPKVEPTPISAVPPGPKPPAAPEPAPPAGPPPVATYLFKDSLAAEETGAPALTPTDPLGRNGFETAPVFGRTQRLYRFSGNPSPTAQQAGLTFDNSSGLLANTNYSVEMVFEFLQKDNEWRRIVDVEDRQSDNGFYVDPGNRLDVYPCPGSGSSFTTGVFHHVVLTNASGTATAYLDGALQFTGATNAMDINNPKNLMHFFLDDFPSAWPSDFSDGKIALLRLYNRVLSDGEVSRLASAVQGTQAAVAAPTPVKDVAADPGNLAGLQNQLGSSHDFRVTGSATGSVWGTDVYTADSALAAAAVHAGVLRPGETGVVRVQMVAGLPAYAGSTRNGVTSAGWNSYPAAYTVSRVGTGRD